MNKVIRYGILIVCFGFVATTVSVSEAKAQGGPLGEILRRMDLNNKSLQSMQADLTMVKYESALKVSDTLIGSTSYLPKSPKHVMYIRVDWKTENGKPKEESMSVIGDDYELYKPTINQVIAGKVQKAKGSPSVGNALGFMTMSKDQLKANYDVVYLGEEQINGGTKTLHLQLTPKSQTSYKSAELWVDGDGMPRQAKVIVRNDDSTTVFLSNIQKNLTLRADIFKFNNNKKKCKRIK